MLKLWLVQEAASREVVRLKMKCLNKLLKRTHTKNTIVNNLYIKLVKS